MSWSHSWCWAMPSTLNTLWHPARVLHALHCHLRLSGENHTLHLTPEFHLYMVFIKLRDVIDQIYFQPHTYWTHCVQLTWHKMYDFNNVSYMGRRVGLLLESYWQTNLEVPTLLHYQKFNKLSIHVQTEHSSPLDIMYWHCWV